MNLRSYQQDAIDATLEAFQTHRSALVVMPTGTGKTVLFSHLARRTQGRVMVIAHREELIRQAADKIKAVTGETCDIEMANDRADLHMYRRSKVVVASLQSLHHKRLKRFRPDDFELVIIDEAHHAVAKSYRRVLDHFSGSKLFGVTATPDRSDEKALGLIFECCPFSYNLTDAIADGYLVPIEQRAVVVESLDFSRVHTLAGDFNVRELSELMRYEENLHKIADPLIKLARRKKTIVFTADKAHCERLTEIVNRHRLNAARFVHDGTPKEERRKILADYRAGRFQYLSLIHI